MTRLRNPATSTQQARRPEQVAALFPHSRRRSVSTRTTEVAFGFGLDLVRLVRDLCLGFRGMRILCWVRSRITMLRPRLLSHQACRMAFRLHLQPYFCKYRAAVL